MFAFKSLPFLAPQNLSTRPKGYTPSCKHPHCLQWSSRTRWRKAQAPGISTPVFYGLVANFSSRNRREVILLAWLQRDRYILYLVWLLAFVYDCKVSLVTRSQAWHFCSLLLFLSKLVFSDAWPITMAKNCLSGLLSGAKVDKRFRPLRLHPAKYAQSNWKVAWAFYVLYVCSHGFILGNLLKKQLPSHNVYAIYGRYENI